MKFKLSLTIIAVIATLCIFDIKAEQALFWWIVGPTVLMCAFTDTTKKYQKN